MLRNCSVFQLFAKGEVCVRAEARLICAIRTSPFTFYANALRSRHDYMFRRNSLRFQLPSFRHQRRGRSMACPVCNDACKEAFLHNIPSCFASLCARDSLNICSLLVPSLTLGTRNVCSRFGSHSQACYNIYIEAFQRSAGSLTPKSRARQECSTCSQRIHSCSFQGSLSRLTRQGAKTHRIWSCMSR